MSRVRPTAAELVDLGFGFGLTCLALVGFRTVFAGSSYLVAGVGGAVIGAALAFVAGKFRLAPVIVGVIAVAVLLAFAAPLALRDLATGGVLPNARTLSAALDGVTAGWHRLLTTVPPVGPDGNVLAIPYLCGFAGAFLAVVLGLVGRRWPVCILPPLAVLGATVLLGTHDPAAIFVQGGVFAVLLLGWIAVRSGRLRPTVVDTGRRSRVVGAIVMMIVVTIVASTVGPHLPLAHASNRYFLRDSVEPPFDPHAYASPLVTFRRYVAGEEAKKVELTVSGHAAGQLIRLATLQEYDGTVWGVGVGEGTGGFRNIGERLAVDGPTVASTVKMGALTGVWLPLAGELSSIRFDGPRAKDLRRSLRYDEAIGTVAVPAMLKTDDTYELRASSLPVVSEATLARRALDLTMVVPLPFGLPPAVKDVAVKQTAAAETPYGKVRRLEKWFQQGFYSDGGEGTTNNPPGHSIARLGDFLKPDQALIGNGEQYASAMAVLLRSLGYPARVVMGFRPPKGTGGTVSVHGGDVAAWVEVAFEGVGWQPFFPTPDKSRIPQEQSHNPKQEEVAPTPPPPPPPTANTIPDQARNESGKGKGAGRRPKPKSVLVQLPNWAPLAVKGVGFPTALVLLVAAVIVGLKASRRRRRRAGSPPARIVGGWRELTDLGRDLGQPVPRRATRREAAQALPLPAAPAIALRADAAIFGADDPSPEMADQFWAEVDAARKAMTADLGRRAALKAALNPASLKPETSGRR